MEYNEDAPVDFDLAPDLAESDVESDSEGEDDGLLPILRQPSPNQPRRSRRERRTTWKDGPQSARLRGTVIEEARASLLEGATPPSGVKRRRNWKKRYHKRTKVRKYALDERQIISLD